MSDSNADTSLTALAVLFIIYRIGVPVMGLYFLFRHATHDVHGFGSFLWYLLVASLEGIVWPLAMFWVS